MGNKKEILTANLRAMKSLETSIFYLEQNGKKQLEIALLYRMIAALSKENATLANEISKNA